MCFGSKADGDVQPAPRPVREISSPQNVTTSALPSPQFPNGSNAGNSKPEIHATQLEHSLQLMAGYLNMRGSPLTAVATGSIINTIHLRTRVTAQGVDVFGSALDETSQKQLEEASQHALRNSPGDLGADWFSLNAGMGLSPSLQQELVDQAVQQQAVVFSRVGLTLLAAPWEYLLTASLSRGPQASEVDDAADYLHQIVLKDRSAIPRARIQQWAAKFKHDISPAILSKLGKAYVQKYGRSAIV